MNWLDHGIFFTQTRSAFSLHAQMPVVDSSRSDIWRIYYSTRNAQNQSLPFYVDVEAGRPKNIIAHSEEPLMPLGEKGDFDVDGIMPTEVVSKANETHLYYIAWNTHGDYPFQNTIALARLSDTASGQAWVKNSKPVIAGYTGCLYTGSLGLFEHQGRHFGFYLACDQWHESFSGEKKRIDPCYQIAIASSDDGELWQQEHDIAITYKNNLEGGIVSARVLATESCFHMFYAYRQKTGFRNEVEAAYKLGYAQSRDLKNWQRHDQLMQGFNDSLLNSVSNDACRVMCCYPYIVEYGKDLFMFYNGDGFGQTGIGVACMEKAALPTFLSSE